MCPATLVRFVCCAAVLAASGSNLVAASGPETAATQAPEIGGWVLAQSGIQGGLIVLVGLGDSGRFLVQGLDTDCAKVAKARQYIQSFGRYGPIAVDRWNGDRLPYIDQLANLVVITDGISVDREEALRVLQPDGVAMTVSTHRELRITDRVRSRPSLRRTSTRTGFITVAIEPRRRRISC